MRLAILSWQLDTRSWHNEQLVDLGKLLGSPTCSPDSIALGLGHKGASRPLIRGLAGNEARPLIRSDPSGRCIAVLAKAQHMFYIVPIRADEDPAAETARAINFSSIFTVDLPSEYEAPNIKDFVFLHGSFEPNIVILYEQKRTWSGRAAVQRNTCFLLTISIDLRTKRTSKQWVMDQLPYDCEKLEAVPDSARGGALVLSASVIMQVRHGSCVAGLSLNCFGDAYAAELRSKYETIVKSDTLVECDAAHCRFLDVEETGADPPINSHQSIALLSLKGGELYFLHVAVDSRNIISMKRAGSTVIASEIVPINDRFFILSSRLSDSLLVEYKRVEDDKGTNGADSNDVKDKKASIGSGKDDKGTRKKRKRTTEEEDEDEMIYGDRLENSSNEDSDEESNKKERTLNLNDGDTEGTRGVYDDEDELGFVFKSDSGTGKNQGAGNWALTVKDTLSCYGPGADVAMGPSPKDATKTLLDMVVAGGYAKNGCLAVVHQTVRPTDCAHFPVPGCDGIWTVLDPSIPREIQRERSKTNAIIVKENEDRKARNAKTREARKQYLQEAVELLRNQMKEQIALEKGNDEPARSPLDVSDTPFKEEDTGGRAKDGIADEKEAAFDERKLNEVSASGNAGSANEAVNAENKRNHSSTDRSEQKDGNDDQKDTKPQKESGNADDDHETDMYGDDSTDRPDSSSAMMQAGKEGLISGKATTEGRHSDDKEDYEASKRAKSEGNITDSHDLSMKTGEDGDTTPIVSQNPSVEGRENVEQGNDLAPKGEVRYNANVDKAGDEQTGNGKGGDSPPRKRQKDGDGNAQSHDGADDSTEHGNIEIDKEDMLQLRRQAEASFPLEAEETLEIGIDGEDSFHSYMLLSTKNATMVLSTSNQDLEEVMEGLIDFVTSDRTVAAGNVLSNNAMVQVVPSKVLVIMNNRLQCQFEVGEGEPKIRSAQICDPLVLLNRENEGFTVLCVKADPFKDTLVSDDGENGPLGKEEFDEYGMPISNGGNALGNGASEKTSEGVQTETIDSFQNFSLSVDFDSKSLSLDDVSVSSAYLYTGPLASEISSAGISDVGKSSAEAGNAPVDAGVQESNGDAAKAAASTTQAKPKEVPVDKGIEADSEAPDAVQMDDDDRMLYGDAVGEEEDEKMLYGSGVSGPAPSSSNNVNDGRKSAGIDGAVAGAPGESVKKSTSSPAHAEKGVLMLEGSSAIEGYGHLLAVVLSSGALKILSRELKYATILDCPYLYTAPSVVTDVITNDGDGEEKSAGTFPPAPPEFQIDNMIMTEVAGSAHLPGFSSALFIMTLRAGLPLVYRAFVSPKPLARGAHRSKLVLKRIEYRDGTTRWFSRLMKRSVFGSEAGNPSHQKSGAETSRPSCTERMKMVPFQNVCGRSGLFIGGGCPAFLFAERGYPRIHEIGYSNRTEQVVSRDEFEEGQAILGMAEFHNVTFGHGFAYIGADEVVRICVLPESGAVNYDGPTPFSKVSLRCTPHKVAYHGGTDTYGVLASMPTLTRREERLARILQSLEKHDKRHYQHTAAQAEAETGDERGERVPPLFEELHELRVYRPDNWNVIKSHKLQVGEVGLAISNMKVNVYKRRMFGNGIEIPSSERGDDKNESLFAASVKLRAKDVFVVGTGHLNGEDASSRGRLLLFEVSKQDIYTEANGSFTAFQLQLIAKKDLLSPVTSVAAMEGYVVAGVGPLISVYKLVGDEIVHLAFTFGQLYATAMATLKQYIVVADMCKSASFHYFRERNKSVNFLAQDHETVTSYATEFLIENENVSMIVSDGEGNLRLLTYAHASVAESQGGKRLLMKGGINLGTRINKFVRVRAPDDKLEIESGVAGQRAGKHALVFVTLDGGVGALVGVSENEFEVFKKLWKTVKEFASIKRCGGVDNEELCRFRDEGASVEMLGQRLLDTRAIYDVFGVTIVEMRVIARRCGMSLHELIGTLLPLEAAMWRF